MSGTLTISIGFKLADGIVEVTGDFKTALPKARRGRSVFWATPDNNLTRRNPRQFDLPLRDAASAGSAVRTIY